MSIKKNDTLVNYNRQDEKKYNFEDIEKSSNFLLENNIFRTPKDQIKKKAISITNKPIILQKFELQRDIPIELESEKTLFKEYEQNLQKRCSNKYAEEPRVNESDGNICKNLEKTPKNNNVHKYNAKRIFKDSKFHEKFEEKIKTGDFEYQNFVNSIVNDPVKNNSTKTKKKRKVKNDNCKSNELKNDLKNFFEIGKKLIL